MTVYTEQPASATDNTNFLEQGLAILRRRWGVVVVAAVLAAGAAVGLSLLQQRQYTASAGLLFRDTQFDQQLFGANFTPTNVDPTRQAATNDWLVSLPIVTARTGAELHLPASVIRSELSVSGVGQADAANATVTDPSPQRAALIANTYVQQYVLFRQGADRAKLASAESLVKDELAALPPGQRYSSIGQSLQNRADELGVMAALQTGNAEVVQPATTPTSPSSPRPTRNGILGGILGLLLGLSIILVTERLDRRFRDPAEIETAYRVPLLGVIPASSAYATARVESLPFREAEAFALLRARLRYFNVDSDIRSLLITSSLPGEGKTTVAMNLATAEASAGNASVVVVEADLRRPAIKARLGLQPELGVADILSRSARLEDSLVTVELPHRPAALSAHFWVLPAGEPPPNPSELLESKAMRELMQRLLASFSLVIIDTPPMSVVSDAIPLMRQVDGVVIVSRIDTTTRDAARHLREQLRKLDAPSLGVVANGAPTGAAGGYYGYYGNYEPTPPMSSNGSASQTGAPVAHT